MCENSDLTQEGLNVDYEEIVRLDNDAQALGYLQLLGKFEVLQRECEALRRDNARLVERVHKLSE
jgi:hypothetical protein